MNTCASLKSSFSRFAGSAAAGYEDKLTANFRNWKSFNFKNKQINNNKKLQKIRLRELGYLFLKEQMYDGRLQDNFSRFLKSIKIVCKEEVTEITPNQRTWFSGRKGTQVLALVLLRQGQVGCCIVAVGSSRTPARARAARQE